MSSKRACPCCGYLTLADPHHGSIELCPGCLWKDDSIQLDDLDYEGGANEPSLRQARENFARYGAMSAEDVIRVRPPREDERP